MYHSRPSTPHIRKLKERREGRGLPPGGTSSGFCCHCSSKLFSVYLMQYYSISFFSFLSVVLIISRMLPQIYVNLYLVFL